MAQNQAGQTTNQAREADAFRAWLGSFHPYQRAFMACEERIALFVKARQIGLSHAIGGDAVKNAIVERSTNVILSASQALSSEVLEKAKGHVRVLERLGFRGAATRGWNAHSITFANGGRVIALPASPRTARSYTGNVYFDEAAYHQDLKGTWDAAAAMATRGRRRIRVISTPNGAQGLFYEWASAIPAGWGYGRFTIDDAIRQGMVVDLDDLWEQAGHDERIFSQWYRCTFLDAAMQYIPTGMADRALSWRGNVPDLAFCELYAGLDVGRQHDLTALVVVAVLNGIGYVLPITTCRRTSFRAQKKMVLDAREMFRWSKLHIDATGLGSQLAEELVEELGEEECVALPFTYEAKADLATRAMRWFRDDRVRLPRGEDGKVLHRDVVSVRREVTSSGNVVYDSPRTASGHGDRFWGLCLALRGTGDPVAPRGMGQEPLLAVG